jgi:hypothetical protein
MSLAQVYTVEEERHLFQATLVSLSPYYVVYQDKKYAASGGKPALSKSWEYWLRIATAESDLEPFQEPQLDMTLCHPDTDKACGEAHFTIEGKRPPAHARLLTLTWFNVFQRFRDLTPCGQRPANLFIQLILQLARLAKVSGMLATRVKPTAEFFYRSFGFYCYLHPREPFDFYVDPQSAFNTISGLLNTRSASRRKAHDTILEHLPVKAQIVCRLQHQEWTAAPDGASLHCPTLRILFELCAFPAKPALQENHARPFVYGWASIPITCAVYPAPTEYWTNPASFAHYSIIDKAVHAMAPGVGEDLRDAARRRI